MKSVHAIRKFGGKKYGAIKKTYTPEGRLNPEFIEEVECSRQKVQEGKGIKFNTVEDFLNSLEK
ncbi:MAG: hypothetical protein PHF18_03590 [Methanosarcina sp.]|uniref:DUF2683 family protein n=1 Tax=Methanosarcina sp. TaxID=2213 RepID=UPI00260CACD6|nr:DUF2683 family protein [Methanosarcina sp.]MDD3245937.1 hypothetical protein [Methanosarcina sp.]MDD4249346.1 hypothetical protein [Methanosarcina sp.]